MNAVNLIPADSRKRRMVPSTSWPTLALIGCLLVVLAGAVLYVTASNKVKSRQAVLAQVTASVESWRRVAGSYAAYTQTAQQRTQELADIRQLAAGRYPWEQLLGQVAGLMPADASLSSLTATTSGSSSSTSGSSSSTSGSTPAATAGSTALPLPAVQLSGCASSQSTVAQTMVQLHRITGVSAVTLSSATDSSAGSGSTSSGSSSAGGCPFRVQFQMSLTFEAPAAPAATSATGSGSSTSSPSTPSTGPGSTPASASTNSTGVQTQ